MNTCRETPKVLDHFAAGRLQPGSGADLRDHLAGCTACGRAVSEYRFVIEGAKVAFSRTEALPPFVRARLAHNAASEARRAPWWSRLVPAGHSPAWAAVAPALLVAAVVALPLALRRHESPVAAGEVPVKIDMQAHDGAVTLAWTDGNGKAYKVYKSSDPRQLGQGRAQIVRGNQWVDSDPESSQIVFYRVE